MHGKRLGAQSGESNWAQAGTNLPVKGCHEVAKKSSFGFTLFLPVASIVSF
jgi:hypothetical protein